MTAHASGAPGEVAVVQGSSRDHVLRAEVAGVLVGILALVVSWWYAEPRTPPWIDEVFTSITARQGVGHAAGHALTYQSQPPVYYVLAAIAWGVEPSIRALRMLSLVGAMLTVGLMVPLGRMLRAGAVTGVLAAACGLWPLLHAYAIEARVYAWAMALVVAHVTSVLWLVSAERPLPRARIVATVVTAVVAMLSFYYTALVVGIALGVAFIAWPAHRRGLALATGGITALMLPWVPTIRRQLAVIAENAEVLLLYAAADETNEALRAILSDGVAGAPLAGRPAFLVSVVAVCVVLLVRAWRAPASAALPAGSKRQLVMLVGPAVGTLVILLGLRATELLMVWPRYVVMVTPLLVALPLVLIGREPRRGLRLAGWGGAALALGALLLSHLRNPPWRPDDRQLDAFLAARVGPGEPVLMADFNLTLRVLQAMRTPQRVVPLPVDTNTTRYRMRDIFVEDPPAVAARVDSAVGSVPGFWFVRRPEVEPALHAIDSLVQARAQAFAVVFDTTLIGLRVSRYARPVPAR